MAKNHRTPEELLSDDPRIWGRFASCKGKPSEWWFADKFNTREGKQFTLMAKEICYRCPVKSKCLELAYETDECFGIWGGLTPKERGYRRMNKVF